MTPGQGDKLIALLVGLREDSNSNTHQQTQALHYLTQEVFLLRKVMELSLPPEAREEFARFAASRPASPPRLAAAQPPAAPMRPPSDAERAEIERAIANAELGVHTHGLPPQVQNTAQFDESLRNLPFLNQR